MRWCGNCSSKDVSIHSRPVRRLTPQPTDRGRADCPSLKGGVTEKDFIGSAVLSTTLFPLKRGGSNHKGIFDEKYTGNGKVVLLAGGGKIYTDIAARFVRSERSLEEIAASPYSRQIVRNILESGHRAALEFDFFLFGVEGYSRVTETQLVRKRLASYLIKSGRAELGGKRRFSVVYPASVRDFGAEVTLPDGHTTRLTGRDLADLTRQWYDAGLEAGLPEEDLRYLKPQATEFKAIIGMNAHALLDWFSIRCCRNAQHEIRHLANQMLSLCRKAAPDLFEKAGPSCVHLGYCPENRLQNPKCRGRILTQEEALAILREHRGGQIARAEEFEAE